MVHHRALDARRRVRRRRESSENGRVPPVVCVCSSLSPRRIAGGASSMMLLINPLQKVCPRWLLGALPTYKKLRHGRSYSNYTTAALQVELVPCLKDNYAYLLHDVEADVVGVIDPSESEPVVRALKKRHLSLNFILNTHHHWDHTGGNMDLKNKFDAKVIGPYIDKDRIPGIDIALNDGELWMFGKKKMLVLDTPGHTRGHICYSFPSSKVIFTGDTLFSLSCGRLFEGTPSQMCTSLSKIASLPAETLIYCGHEYTLSNAEFALTLEPRNEALKSYYNKVKELRQAGLPTIPTSLKLECSCNPFLRLSSPELRKSLGFNEEATNVQVLGAVRAAKDKW